MNMNIQRIWGNNGDLVVTFHDTPEVALAYFSLTLGQENQDRE